MRARDALRLAFRFIKMKIKYRKMKPVELDDPLAPSLKRGMIEWIGAAAALAVIVWMILLLYGKIHQLACDYFLIC